MPQDQDNFQVAPPEPVQTGLEGLVPTEPTVEPTLPTAEQVAAAALEQLPAGDARRPDAPVENTSLTAAEIRAAEINEGARQNKRHEHLPQPVHPAVEAGEQNNPLASTEPAPAVTKLHRPKGETIEQRIRRQDQEARLESEARKSDFIQRVLEARHPPARPEPAQPVAPAITAQTRREMAEGARQNARHEEFYGKTPMPRHPDPTENGNTTSIFRPADYVPGMHKGDVKATPVT
jgi:hypothetical protein